MKDNLIITGSGIVISVCLVAIAWSYGEWKKIEGRQEAGKEFNEVLTKLRIDLLEAKLKVINKQENGAE